MFVQGGSRPRGGWVQTSGGGSRPRGVGPDLGGPWVQTSGGWVQTLGWPGKVLGICLENPKKIPVFPG